MNNGFNLNEEIIDDYKVTEIRKRLWATELDMLEMIEKTCKAYDIDYFMLMGSAIGVERHHGFIPWDDDIDLGMLRDDFDKFLKCPKDFFPEYIDIQYGLSDHGADFLLRIRDSRTTGIIRGELGKPGCKGAFVEIYVYDYVDSNPLSNKFQLFLSRTLCALMSAKVNTQRKKMSTKIEALVASCISMAQLWKLYEKNCKMYKKEECDFVNLVSLPKYGKVLKHRARLKDLERTEYKKFEYVDVRVAIGNDSYLKQLYGDYMKLPPIEKRGIHHDNIVFYDPDRSYTEYENSDVIKRYFDGDSSLELL